MNSYFYHQHLSADSTNNQHMPSAPTASAVGADLLPPLYSSSPVSSPPPPPIVYGELSILGHNGYIPHSGERNGRRNKSKFLLCKRPFPNGIKKSRHYIVKQPQETIAVQDKALHSISYTFSRSQTIVVEYKQDENTDMFQIGRSSEEPIDFVVMDTVPAGCNLIDTPGHMGSVSATVLPNQPDQVHFDFRRPVVMNYPSQQMLSALGYPYHDALLLHHQHQQPSNTIVDRHQHNNHHHHHHHRSTQSTISRFACRILVDREPPYTARIYAAGFDSSKNIFLGEKATKWELNNSIDGLTTNGVLLMHKTTNVNNNNDSNNNDQDESNEMESEYSGIWREVSVDGGIYAIRESRSAVQKGKRIENETNVLRDGTLIDLCGATLLWRSLDGFRTSPTKKSLEEKIDMLNASRPQCPVGLNTLVIPRKPILPNAHHRSNRGTCKDNQHGGREKDGARGDEKGSHQPYVYLKCGHVQGYHDWGATSKMNQRKCPVCMTVGTVAKLSMGLEPSFYVDSGPLTHVFNPCGHMASERTVKYWSSIKIPHGTHYFHSICPFCATPLTTTEQPATKLIFQEGLD